MDFQAGDEGHFKPDDTEFEKLLSGLQTVGIMKLERSSLTTPPRQRASVLNPLIETICDQLNELLPRAPGDVGK